MKSIIVNKQSKEARFGEISLASSVVGFFLLAVPFVISVYLGMEKYNFSSSLRYFGMLSMIMSALLALNGIGNAIMAILYSKKLVRSAVFGAMLSTACLVALIGLLILTFVVAK